MSEVDTHIVKIEWTAGKRAVAYGSFLLLVLIGCVMWPIGMSPRSVDAALWYVCMLWNFGFSVAAFRSAYREAQNREPFGGYMVGPRPGWWDSESMW